MKNRIFLHNENGITHLNVNGNELFGVSDYKMAMSANGKAELTFTITVDCVVTDLEVMTFGTPKES